MDPDRLGRLGGPFGFAVHPEVMQAKEASQQDAGLLVARYDNRAGRGAKIAAQGPCARPRTGSHLTEPITVFTCPYYY